MERHPPGRRGALIRSWRAAALLAVGCASAPPDPCVTFVGDVSLARGVAEEIARRGDPWTSWPPAAGELRVGNLEGSLATAPCTRDDGLCLEIAVDALDHLGPAGFAAMSLANNHSGDHGDAGLAATAAALQARGLIAISAGDGPHLLEHGGRTWTLVGVDLVHPDRQPDLDAALREVSTARARTPWVAALLHDGLELEPDPTEGQRRAAAALVAHGATLVIGAHSHVVQPL